MQLVFASTQDPAEFFRSLPDDMTLEQATEYHLLADDAGIEAEPIDIDAILMGVL